jgi:hypothetical protein
MTPFANEQIERLINSGWSQCASVARAIAAAGLPAVTPEYLAAAFSTKQWLAAEQATLALRDSVRHCRFASEVVFGVLLVPDPNRLDTRRPMAPSVRRDQLGRVSADAFDERLGTGRLGVRSGPAWTLLATVTGRYGLACGSYDAVVHADRSKFTVCGVDTRTLMIRQIWGARVLQCGNRLPDCELNDRWTFTIFPGEPLREALAESGTVLKGRVRFRLGKADRGIASARVAPALVVS